MNKYQDAFEKASLCCLCTDTAEEAHEYLDILKELVDKAAPKFIKCPKGWNGNRYTRYYCPSCNKAVELANFSFCKRCGQALKYPKKKLYDNKIVLDWSDEE